MPVIERPPELNSTVSRHQAEPEGPNLRTLKPPFEVWIVGYTRVFPQAYAPKASVTRREDCFGVEDVPLVEREPVAAQDSESLIGEFLAFAPLAGQDVIQAELQKRSDEMAARGCSDSNLVDEPPCTLPQVA